MLACVPACVFLLCVAIGLGFLFGFRVMARGQGRHNLEGRLVVIFAQAHGYVSFLEALGATTVLEQLC